MENFNQTVVDTFIKSAQEAGVSNSEIEQFVSARYNVKTASQQLDEVISGILKQAGVEKTDETSQHVTEVLKVAVAKGMNDEKAVELAKIAAQQYKGNNNTMPQRNFEQEKQAAAAEGFIKAAQDYGFSYGQSIDLYHNKIAELQQVEKQADMHSMVEAIKSNPQLLELIAGIKQNQEMVTGGAVGALGGAAVGAATGGKDHKLRNALIGGGVGGAAGAGLGHAWKQEQYSMPMDHDEPANNNPHGGEPGAQKSYMQQLAKLIKSNPEIAGALGGAGVGGAGAALIGDDKHRGRNAGIGAAGGAALGAAGASGGMDQGLLHQLFKNQVGA